MDVARQVGLQHGISQRQVIPILSTLPFAPPASDRRQPTRLTCPNVLPAGGVDIPASVEQGTVEGDLPLGLRTSCHAGPAIEQPCLRRTRPTRLFRSQLEEAEQPSVLGSKPLEFGAQRCERLRISLVGSRCSRVDALTRHARTVAYRRPPCRVR